MLKGKNPPLHFGLMSGEPTTLTYTEFKLEKGANKLQIELANRCLFCNLRVFCWPVGRARLVLNGFYMDVHTCAARHAAHFLSEHFAPV